MGNDIEKINKLYKEYFEIIDSYFGGIKQYLGDEEKSHINLGQRIANYPMVSDLILDAIDDIDDKIKNFWSKNTNILIKSIKNQKSLKCLFSGKSTPAILENFIKRSALYIDTVIIPDPLYNLTLFKDQIYEDKKYYLYKLIRNVFNVWKIRDLILADTEEKIAIIMPINLDAIHQSDRSKLLNNAEQLYINYINKIFGKDFSDLDMIFNFFKQQKSVEDVFGKFTDTEILPNTFKDLNKLKDFLDSFKESGEFAKISLGTMGEFFGFYINAQFVRI